jgi:formyltetrahydrofolate deformylase
MTTHGSDANHILTLSCPDRPGIVHAVSGLLLRHGGNIEEAAQHHDRATGLFFMRVQFACPAAAPDLRTSGSALRGEVEALSAAWGMQAQLRPAGVPMPTVVMVSREGHCLNDLLFRCKSAQLPIDIRAVISNHREFEALVSSYGIAFHHTPVSPDTKREVQAQQLEIIRGVGAELVVLARYMQVLGDDMCRALEGHAINIHHSFLPSFKGARPYQQAHERGVKLIGATAHYVTAELDEGPIIEQDVARADHGMSTEDLAAVGRDTECVVLSRAVKWHSEHRVLLDGHKTVVFR